MQKRLTGDFLANGGILEISDRKVNVMVGFFMLFYLTNANVAAGKLKTATIATGKTVAHQKEGILPQTDD
ncbi:hypothetical protein [Shimwellia blattae]|nr:hypothetical protein [Shimwellia blattae]